jgi:hypothetical protein
LDAPSPARPACRRTALKIFREAYNKAMKDPALLIEAKHTPLEINPTTGQELDALAKEVVSQPNDVVERMKKLMGR